MINRNNLKKIQSALLLLGTVYAWTNVYISFRRFYSFEGEIFKFKDCFITNPMLTPCFWGAAAFLIAFLWSLKVYFEKDDARFKKSQNGLVYLLIFGTIFAWSVFAYELITYLRSSTGQVETCLGTIDTPLKSSCLYGAIIYTAALINGLKLKRNLFELTPQ